VTNLKIRKPGTNALKSMALWRGIGPWVEAVMLRNEFESHKARKRKS
jgi:hypothetical protein